MQRRNLILLLLAGAVPIASQNTQWDNDFMDFIDELNDFMKKWRHGNRDQKQWRAVEKAFVKLEGVKK